MYLKYNGLGTQRVTKQNTEKVSMFVKNNRGPKISHLSTNHIEDHVKKMVFDILKQT